jgi:hypothetical protein
VRTAKRESPISPEGGLHQMIKIMPGVRKEFQIKGLIIAGMIQMKSHYGARAITTAGT